MRGCESFFICFLHAKEFYMIRDFLDVLEFYDEKFLTTNLVVFCDLVVLMFAIGTQGSRVQTWPRTMDF
jgi:hypothetical protein